MVSHLNGGGTVKPKRAFVLCACVAACVPISSANSVEPIPNAILFSESCGDREWDWDWAESHMTTINVPWPRASNTPSH